MKIYIKSSKQYVSSSDDPGFDSWCEDSNCDDDREEFVWSIISKLKDNYPGCKVDNDSPAPDIEGIDYWRITLDDDSEYVVDFDYEEELYTIFEDGPEAASTKYLRYIISEIGLT